MKRRYCLHCGKRLPWRRQRNQFETRAEAEKFIATLPREIARYAKLKDESQVSELNPGHPNYRFGVFFVSFFASEGRYGDNRFCGISHGYGWAVQHTQEARPR